MLATFCTIAKCELSIFARNLCNEARKFYTYQMRIVTFKYDKI